MKLWQLDGTLITTLTGHDDWVTNINFSADGNILASYSDDETTKLWHIENELLRVFESDSTRFSYEPDNENEDDDNGKQKFVKAFTTSLKDGQVKLWQADGTFIKTLIEKSEGLVNVSFHSQGQFLVTDVKKGEALVPPIKLWRIDGTPLATLVEKSANQEKVSFQFFAEFFADNQFLVTTVHGDDDDGPVQLWRTENGELIKTLIAKSDNKGRVNVRVADEGRTLVTTIHGEDSYGPVQLWQTDGTLIKTLVEKSESKGRVNVNVSKDGRSLVTTIRGKEFYGPVQLWHAEDGKLIKTLITKSEKEDDEWVRIGVIFNDKSHILVTTISGEEFYGPVQLWHAEDGKLIKTFIEKSKKVDDEGVDINVVFNDNNRTLLTMVRGETFYDNSPVLLYEPVQLWHAEDGELIKTLIAKSDRKERVNVNLVDDGQRLVTTILGEKFYGPVQLWRAEAGELIKTLIEKSPKEDGERVNVRVSFNEKSHTLMTTIFWPEFYGPVQLWQTDGTPPSTLSI